MLAYSLLEQVFPTETEDDGTPKKDRRSREYVDRPSFSLPAMSTNFRRFNARCVAASPNTSFFSSTDKTAESV